MKKILNKHSIKNLIIYMFFFSLIFSAVYFIKDNIKKQEEVKNTIQTLFKDWNGQNMEGIYNISNEEKAFHYSTGFEDNEVINEIVEKHIYEGPEYELLDKTMAIEGIGKKDAKASVTINLKTYNNLEVLDTIIAQLLNDDSKITKDYEHEEFVKSNESSIKDATKDIKKTSQKTLIIYLECNDGKWTIPYAHNIELYNAMSGGIITFSQSVNTEVDIK